MLAEHHDRNASGDENHRDQLGELAVTQHGCALKCTDSNLSENLTGSGERFDEDGFFIRNCVWDRVEIFERQREEFCEGAVVSDDSEHLATGAVGLEAAAAKFAGAPESESRAGDIDLAGDAAA